MHGPWDPSGQGGSPQPASQGRAFRRATENSIYRQFCFGMCVQSFLEAVQLMTVGARDLESKYHIPKEEFSRFVSAL